MPPLGSQPGIGGSFSGLGGLGGATDYMTLGGGFGTGIGLSSPMLGGAGGLLGQSLQTPLPSQLIPQSHMTSSSSEGAGIPNSRLFIVVHKSATEEALSALFRCYPGMEYLDLKRDRVTGRSKGYAYVNYVTDGAAAAAQFQLNGIEYPPGTGSRLKVLFAEPLQSGALHRVRSDEEAGRSSSTSGRPGGSSSLSGTTTHTVGGSAAASRERGIGSLGQSALASAAAQQQQAVQLSARTDPSSASHDSLLSPHSSPLRLSSNAIAVGDAPGASRGVMGTDRGGGGSGGDLAATLGSLSLQDAINAHTSTSVSGVFNVGHTSPLQTARSDASGGGNVGMTSGEPSPDPTMATTPASTASLPLALPLPSPNDSTVVYSALSRPLPDSALTTIFQQCGPVEFVRILPEERIAMVKYASPEAAAAAVGSLNGVEVLGEVLQVRSSPPLCTGKAEA